MISMSFDAWKVQTDSDRMAFMKRIVRLKYLAAASDTKIGVNLLVSKEMFQDKSFIKIVSFLFQLGVDRVYALYPKNFPLSVDIRDYKNWYNALTLVFPGFCVDDLTQKILSEGYKDWKSPCHFGRDIINIDFNGKVYGCSFSKKPFGSIKEASDILGLVAFVGKPEQMKCPHLKNGGNLND
jgi:MoaA/NifB/PqqE/SkfB family radical SAM enzyme